MITTTDMCIGFFDCFLDAGHLSFPINGRVLEVGCAEGDAIGPLKRARPDLHVTGIDWRDVQRPAADRVVCGDVLTYDFEPESFDAVIAVSTLEHIGLKSYGDPDDPNGDTHALQRMASWVKPDGWIYFDVPYRPTGPYSANSNFRAYDPVELGRRLTHAVPGWSPTVTLVISSTHPDGPYIAVKMERM